MSGNTISSAQRAKQDVSHSPDRHKLPGINCAFLVQDVLANVDIFDKAEYERDREFVCLGINDICSLV